VVAPSPTVLKRYVALELRRLRETAGLPRDKVAARLRCASSHIAHLEIGRNLPRTAELEVLLGFYGVSDRIPEFLELVDAARRGKDWWLPFKGVIPDWFDLYLGMESSATQIEAYAPAFVPGLFQTRRYAQAVIRARSPELPDADLGRRIELRMARQDALVRQPSPPSVRCVLDEAVLLRLPPRPEIMAEQLHHLIKLSDLPNVTIQVLPLAAGLHAGFEGPFTILTFPPDLLGDPGVVYTDTRFRATYYQDPAEIHAYRNTWTDIRLAALTPDQTHTHLTHRIKELTP